MATCVNLGTQQYFGFDPRTIPGCAMWLDAADARTLTTNGSGNVTSWTDKSGAGATLTAVGIYSNATLQTNYQNGLTAVNFTGSNLYRSPSNTGVYPSDVYILVALKTLNRMDVMGIGSTGVDNFNSLTFGEFTALRWHNGSSGFARTPLTVAPANETSTSLLLMNWSIANNNFVLRRNGTQLSSTASYTYTLTAPSAMQLGYRHTDAPVPLITFDAFVAEVVVYNRQLTLGERQQVEGYLARKWALTANLPTGHPFRSNPLIMRAFQPVDISDGCLLWLDAADASTITGSPVTQWRDKSGRASNAVTGAGSVVSGTAINSRNTLRFGVADRLNLSNFVMPSVQTSVFYVFRGITSNTGGGTGYFIWSRTADNFSTFSGNQQFACYQNPGAGRSYVLVMGPNGERNWGNLPTTAFANAVNVIATTGISYASSNGLSLPLVGAANVSNSVLTATTYQVSASRSCCADAFQYDLGELVVYNGTVSTATAQQLEGYLAWKWGVQGSLPSTHPYSRVLPSTPLFVPTQISSISLWIDVADATTFTVSGGTLTAIQDKSGTGKTMTINSAPTYSSNGFNNRPGLVYTSGNRISTTTTALGRTATLIAVHRITVNATSVPLALGLANSGTETGIGFNSGSAYYNLYDFGVAETGNTSVTTSNVSLLHIGVKTTSNLTAFVNGTASTPAASTFSNAATQINLGGGGFAFVGVLAEAIVYSTPLSTFERQEVEGYLAWKWGLQSSLPSTHPFAQFRP